MSQWKLICRVDDIPALGARRVVRAKGIAVAVFRTADDSIHALLDRCPHKGGPLSQGIVVADSVSCPLHGWSLRFDTGAAKEPDIGSTPKFSVRVVDGEVFLDSDELATLALDLLPPTAGPKACSHA
ncbi:MAG: nitrite reductase small subunit NirD [Burkholderiales bacterium]